MPYRHRRPLLALALIGNATVPVRLARASEVSYYDWDDCEKDVRRIIDGTLVVNGVDNSTISSYLYHGPVTQLSPSYPREKLLTITYEGCVKLCRNPIAIYKPETAIGLVSNWLFPLNILLSLPFESLHRKKFRLTLVAILNWLGSPQTALTATIFNFRQLRQSHGRVQQDANEHDTHLLCAAFFVLCSINQFDIDPRILHGRRGDNPPRMLRTLVYGLFRPLSSERTADGAFPAPDVELTRQLLVQLAYQLRMYRRKGVIPMLSNLGTFLIAFIFSVVLAFAQLGEDKNSPFSLSFGLLVTWLPLLVVFTIVDRNPVSGDRSAELISRWLYNVDAVMTWSTAQRDRDNRRESDPTTVLEAPSIASVDRQSTLVTLTDPAEPKPEPAVLVTELTNTEEPQAGVDWWKTTSEIPPDLEVGNFIGQGRKIQYCGIPHAFLEATKGVKFSKVNPTELAGHATAIAQELQGDKPWAWYVVAIVSLFLVWTAIMSAFVVSFMSPVVGLGCRTLTYLIFGACSSVPWLIQFRKRPGKFLTIVSHVFNTLAILALLTVVAYQVTGLASNCFCKSSAINRPFLGGYIDFENYSFYRDHYNVIPFWIFGAVVGGLVPTAAFVVALFWWVKCRQIWKANERTTNYPVYAVRASTEWLQ
ncbi:hypothetical protein V8F20_010657 [Naviculisporaceae sp. PSN 640]